MCPYVWEDKREHGGGGATPTVARGGKEGEKISNLSLPKKKILAYVTGDRREAFCGRHANRNKNGADGV